MAINPLCPALIDPPYFGTLAEWVEFRADMLAANLVGAEPFVLEAEQAIVEAFSRGF